MMNTDKQPSSLFLDATIAVTLTISVFAAFIFFDLTEAWFHFTRQHEEYELDETIGLVIGALLGSLFLVTKLLRHTFSSKRQILTLYADIEEQALTDFLTKLPNRRALAKHIQVLINRPSEKKNEFTLFFVDLDSFKYVNDTLGHSVGDKLLLEVTTRLCQSLSEANTVFRIGGDEFAIVIPSHLNDAQCLDICQQLNREIEKPFCVDNFKLHISQTIGIGRFPQDGSSFEQVLKVADTAMFMGKKSEHKRNNFKNRDFMQDMERWFIVQHGLNDAISRDELFVEYQPKISLVDKQMVGSEALVRWKHPQHGFIPPDHFIYIAEESNVVDRIDFYVLERVCKYIKLLGDLAKPVAVNLSPMLFADENLANKILSILKKYGIPPHLIELEITERTLVANSAIPLRICKSLNNAGIKLSLDDFGTGYSSLSHIADFPISTIKVDRAFINNICDNERTKDIVTAVIKLAKALNINVIAEGVETAEQETLLQGLECAQAQGYYYAKPLPSDQFIDYLRRTSNTD